ncbi:conserved hypothetical protein [Ricinus communis]|uniref:Uncharacterized protein n=1 Tax=Ricinus communis TaxID=3988 RepID=B9SLY8_RICCO|nr:conserved hypothetical protein [Ricinus communis]
MPNGVLDFSNERSVLLSKFCIPYFTIIYNHFMNYNQSFQGSFDDPRSIGVATITSGCVQSRHCSIGAEVANGSKFTANLQSRWWPT